jgi:ribonuclease-3
MSAEQECRESFAGHLFCDPSLLRRALTHKSYAHEQPEEGAVDNEQLEFLGDSILGFLVSELLISRFPALAEGRLSKLKARLVSADHLCGVAARLDLGAHLVLGRGEELSGGRAKPALLADALEALIAAIYLDAGIDAARRFVLEHVTVGLDSTLPLADYKGALAEAAQASGLPAPQYLLIGQRGPEHAKYFTVEARIGRDLTAEAEDRTKKSAAQKAAQLLLERLSGGQACSTGPESW